MPSTLTTRAAELRSRLRRRRETRADRARLRAELATYTSAADRLELAAVLARHDPRDVDRLRALLR